VLWGIPLPPFSVLFCPEDKAAGSSKVLVLRLKSVDCIDLREYLQSAWIMNICEQFQSSFAYLLQSAQAELAVLKTELEFLKSNPQPDGQKGNSLFAEVEDKRLDMKKKLDAVFQKYQHTKKIYKNKCAELSRVNVCSQSFILLL
jgi:capsule polysaccharide export protein KpsE/RkpR